MLLPLLPVQIQTLVDERFDAKGVTVAVLRLDELHPVVSGNKLFKLHFFLEKALQTQAAGIVTFGGAWSNHLVATAFACKSAALRCVGIVRGARPAVLSHTLVACLDYGMELKFISREAYNDKEAASFAVELSSEYNNYLVIPEGGYSDTGRLGAALIMDLVPEAFTHLCCAVGTATTIAGLVSRRKPTQQVVAVPVLKNLQDLPERIKFLTNIPFEAAGLSLLDNYHFGGYAKKTSELTGFMNALFRQHKLPTDFVYTGKLMFGILDAIDKNFFPANSNILCIHTGGLQGNASLPAGTLVF